MKSNILLATIVAVTTAVGAVAVFYPAILIAEDEPVATPPEIITPILAVNGCELTLAAITDADADEGDFMHVLLTVTNASGEPVEFSAVAGVNSRPAMDGKGLGRRMPMPTMLWQETVEISLGAEKSTTIELTTDSTAATWSGGPLWLQVGDETVVFNPPVITPIVPVEEAPVDVPAEELPETEAVTL